jgi:predicted transposase YdaD
MGLRYEQELVARLLRGVMGMEESTVYQAIIEQGIARGEIKGRREEARRMILLQGTKRFGPPAADVTAALEAIDDLERLEELQLKLLDVASWPELLPPTRRRSSRRKPSS